MLDKKEYFQNSHQIINHFNVFIYKLFGYFYEIQVIFKTQSD